MVMLDGPLPTMPEGDRVLVVMAHPDDAEFGCGGTIAKWAAAGKEINYVLCTSGDKGSSDPDISPYRLAQTRRSEQINAAHALGAREVVFLSHEDGTLRNTIELRRDIVREIRRFRLQPNPSGNPPNITYDPFRIGFGIKMWMVDHN